MILVNDQTKTELQAVRASRWVDDRLVEGAPCFAVVHSVFRRVVNLRLDSGHFLSLSAQELPLAPNGIALELPLEVEMENLGVRLGQEATLIRQALLVPAAHLEVNCAGARRWDPRPRVPRVSPGDLMPRIQRAHAKVIAHGAAGSLLPLLEGDKETNSPPLVRAARPHAELLYESASAPDHTAVREAASRLAGLGPGLTPSGDDFLAGFVAAWVLTTEASGLPLSEVSQVAGAISDGASSRASELGSSWIMHAAFSEVAEPMGRFFTALFSNDCEALLPAVLSVVSLGATSGTDWMVGALFGARAALVLAGAAACEALP
jgi:hypothetical protein